MSRSVPLYEQVAESLRDQILSGKLAIYAQLPSQKILAEQYHVSLITIKRAILELVNEGLLFGQPGKGVFVGRSRFHDIETASEINSIGVIISNLSSPFYSTILESIESEANLNNYLVIISKPSAEENGEALQIDRVIKSGIKGLIIASRDYSISLSPHLERTWRQGVPMVFVSYTADNRINYIGSDHKKGAYMATKHLIELGYQNIAYVTPNLDDPLCVLRYYGYRDALSGSTLYEGKENIISYSNNNYTNLYETGYVLGQRISQMDPRPDAIFTFTDLIALGVKRAMKEKNLRIPQDLAIVGFDDIPTAGQVLVPLTTVRQPIKDIGCLALNTLLKKIDGDHSITRTLIPPKLIIRDSCGAPYSTKTQL